MNWLNAALVDELLHYVPPRVGVPLVWLAERLDLSPRSCAELVREMERRGLVSARRAHYDRRCIAVVLTPAGAARVERGRRLDLAA